MDRPSAKRGHEARIAPALTVIARGLLVGDLILCEILQGLRTDTEARVVEEALREFKVVSLVGPELAVKAAAKYRFLRSRRIYDPQDHRSHDRHILYRARP